jgi:hypothetical protein
MKVSDGVKSFIADDAIFYGLLILLTAIASFGLGRWSVVSEATIVPKHPITYTQGASVTQSRDESREVAQPTNSEPVVGQSTTSQYVGSKNGTKYHLTTCPGAKQIKEENKVYFASKEEAQKAGYTPASNCKGI